MPRGYKYSQKNGRWEKINKEHKFDYLNLDIEVGKIIIALCRYYPDRMLDLIESEDADFGLVAPSRLILRSFVNYQKSITTTSRGMGKTYNVVLAIMWDGAFLPGKKVRYYAPSLNQGAELASRAFHQIEKNYPALAELWKIKSETKDLFWISTDYGSEMKIGAVQGGNCHMIIGEEIGQETDPKFDFHDFESKALPTCRLDRRINKEIDRCSVPSPHQIYITNASSRQNKSYSDYRHDTRKKMINEPRFSGLQIDISWEMSVLFGIRTIEYVNTLKSTMTHDDFLKQMCAYYTGSAENPLISDEDLSKSRSLMCMETRHCGNPNVTYIIGHDVSYEEGTRNAKCADIVMKLTRFENIDEFTTKKDKFKKEIVWAETYPPPKDHTKAAMRIKDLWRKFTLDGGQATWIAIDAWQYGNAVMKELIKPCGDNINLCCYKHLEGAELEQPNALPVIYPVKAGGTGVRDNDYDMIRYMRVEFEQGNVNLLTSDMRAGLEQYKINHNIKNGDADGKILKPYYHTSELAEQIMNLQVVPSGKGFKESRISKSIQRDLWSATKYAGRVAAIIETLLEVTRFKGESTYQKAIENITSSHRPINPTRANIRSNLLKLRRR